MVQHPLILTWLVAVRHHHNYVLYVCSDKPVRQVYDKKIRSSTCSGVRTEEIDEDSDLVTMTLQTQYLCT